MDIFIDCMNLLIRLGAEDDETPGAYTDGEIVRCGHDLGIAARDRDVLAVAILNHAVAGIDVTDPAYLEGIETTLELLRDDDAPPVCERCGKPGRLVETSHDEMLCPPCCNRKDS